MATVNGGNGNDTLGGGARADVINGFGANDLLTGAGGNDQLFGGAGLDTINGGTGNDTVFGGAGVDTMIGGAGIDTMSTFFFSGNYVFNLATGETNFAGETATGFENATTGNGSDLVTGSAAANLIHTNGGNDRLLGAAGNDSLFGGIGGDTLEGGAGNDRINGGLGFDRASGGQGFDVFEFSAPLGQANSGPDRILDFSHANDGFRLDDAVFTGLAVGALGAARFHVGTNAAAASHRIIYDDATGRLFFDADGTGGTGKVLFAQVNPDTLVLRDDFSVF